MEKKDYCSILASNLLKVREKTGLSQNDFYKKYFLGQCEKKGCKTDLSMINVIKRYESGANTPSIAQLVKYSQIGHCSIDELITNNELEIKADTDKPLTYPDLVKSYINLDYYNVIEFGGIEKKKDGEKVHADIRINDFILSELIMCIDQYKRLLQKSLIDENLYDNAIAGLLDRFNFPILEGNDILSVDFQALENGLLSIYGYEKTSDNEKNYVLSSRNRIKFFSILLDRYFYPEHMDIRETAAVDDALKEIKKYYGDIDSE